jgi:hypothetical protein
MINWFTISNRNPIVLWSMPLFRIAEPFSRPELACRQLLDGLWKYMYWALSAAIK